VGFTYTLGFPSVSVESGYFILAMDWDGEYLWVVIQKISSTYTRKVCVYGFDGITSPVFITSTTIANGSSSTATPGVTKKIGNYQVVVVIDYMYSMSFDGATITTHFTLNETSFDYPQYLYSDSSGINVLQYNAGYSTYFSVDNDGRLAKNTNAGRLYSICKVAGTPYYLAGNDSKVLNVCEILDTQLSITSTYTFPNSDTRNLKYVVDIGDGYFFAVWGAHDGIGTSHYIQVLKLNGTTLSSVLIYRRLSQTPTNAYMYNGCMYDGDVLVTGLVYNYSTENTLDVLRFNKNTETLNNSSIGVISQSGGFAQSYDYCADSIVLAKGIFLFLESSSKIGGFKISPSATFTASKLYAYTGDTITFTPT